MGDMFAMNQEVVAEIVRAFEMDWSWNDAHLDEIPSLEDSE